MPRISAFAARKWNKRHGLIWIDIMPAIVAGANNLLGSVRRVEAMKDVPTTADAPKRHLRWFQFRLRTVFVVTTLIAVAAGWVGWQAKIVQERKWLRDHSGASFLP